nr:integrase, catalytic region, zinc finger, CCHC-type, peptidase aspartic, catalytic [Tanacetum cinerariifolium]
MARQCTQPKRPRNSTWFKEKLMLTEAQEAGQILDEEQLAFLAELGINKAPVAQQIILQNSAFQTEDLDAYDSDYDDLSSAKVILMENISSCDSDILSEVPYSDSYLDDIINQDVQEMPYSEQSHIDNFQDNEINSDSNIISYIDLKEESRSKMLDKQNDPILKEKKINISLIDYSKLNKLKEDFGKRFVTQKEFFAKQAFWSKHTNHSFDTSDKSHTPVRIEAPNELTKVSLVNESLKKLKYHLASFNKVMKKRTISDAITAGMFMLDIEPISNILKNNRDAHEVYLEKTIENTDTLRGLVERTIKQMPSEPLLDSACKFAKKHSGNVSLCLILKATRSVGSSSKVKIVESKIFNFKEPKQSWGSNIFDVPSSSLNDYRLSKLFYGTVRFGNDHITKKIGYENYQMGKVTIARVYYVEGLCHNLFFVGQFYDSDLEVAFRKHTYFIRDMKGVDLLKGSRGSNLYTLSLENLMLSSHVCLLSKASKTKSWLWHRRLSHLNFDYVTSLAKQGLV